MSHRSVLSLAAFACAAGSLAPLAAAQPVRARLAIAVGQPLPGTAGLTCSALNDPYTAGNGKIGFTGSATGGVGAGNFVWFDTGVVWLNANSVAPTLTGAEGTMGVSNTGGFIYSPTEAGGLDAVWTHAGHLLAEGELIPSINKYSTFNSRPRMTANGGAIWPAGFADVSGGAATSRGFLYVADVAAPVFQAVIQGGSTYGGVTTTATATNLAYDISDNGLHRVHQLTATGATATDIFMYHSSLDMVIAREGSPVPGAPAENFTAFRIPGVNNFGDWVLAGDTTAATTGDEVVVYNGAVMVREGQIIDGSTLSGVVNAVSINNRKRVAVIFNGTPEVLLAGPAATFTANARTLLNVGDQIDTTGDGVCDYMVMDFNASNGIAPGLDIADDGMVWVNVDLAPCGGGTAVEGIIGVRDICPPDFDNSGTLAVQDIFDFLAAWFAGNPNADFDVSGNIAVSDIFDFLSAWFAGC